MRQNYFTCRLGKCGGRASFTRWIFKFISRIGVVVVVVVIFVIDLGGLDVRIHAKKNVKVFFGLEFLGSFFRGIISILKMQMNACQKDENRSESLISKRFVWTKPCLQAMCK